MWDVSIKTFFIFFLIKEDFSYEKKLLRKKEHILPELIFEILPEIFKIKFRKLSLIRTNSKIKSEKHFLQINLVFLERSNWQISLI